MKPSLYTFFINMDESELREYYTEYLVFTAKGYLNPKTPKFRSLCELFEMDDSEVMSIVGLQLLRECAKRWFNRD